MATRAIRPIRVEGNIAYVPLTQGYEAVIDAADAPLVEGKNWNALVRRRPDGTVYSVYATRNSSSQNGERKAIFMHQAIMNVPKGIMVDHCDSDGLNNRRMNLRPASNNENQWNSRIRSDNASGLKGVSWHKRDKYWRAQIKKHGKVTYLGGFRTKEDAAAAYAKASAEQHGEFGRLS